MPIISIRDNEIKKLKRNTHTKKQQQQQQKQAKTGKSKGGQKL